MVSDLSDVALIAKAAQMPDGVDILVVDKNLPKIEEASDCLCEQGYFWHWRIAKCIKQGPWGYECGFFPMEHHHRVCQDGYKCERPANSEHIKYLPLGDSKKAQTFPASCAVCAQGECLVGKERQAEECLKEYAIAGEKACVTVKVGTLESAVAKATKEYTATQVVDGTATATANFTAKKKEVATSTQVIEAMSNATVNATGKAEAEHTAKVHVKTTATVVRRSTQNATASENATVEVAQSANHTETAQAIAKKSYRESFKGRETAIEDEVTAKVEVTENATKKANATREAKAHGSATKTVAATAAGKGEGMATAKAKVEKPFTITFNASATAEANRSAQAEVEVTATATETRRAQGMSQHTASATESMTATERGEAVAEGCAAVDEAYRKLGFEFDKKLSAVLGAKIIGTMEDIAFEKAYAKAMAEAKKNGLVNAQTSAAKLAEAKAFAEAMRKAEAKAREAAAWIAEAGANKMAKAAAFARAKNAAEMKARAAAAKAAKKKQLMPKPQKWLMKKP
jgi:hypothetical protein